jgi:hypothetical protein
MARDHNSKQSGRLDPRDIGTNTAQASIAANHAACADSEGFLISDSLISDL